MDETPDYTTIMHAAVTIATSTGVAEDLRTSANNFLKNQFDNWNPETEPDEGEPT